MNIFACSLQTFTHTRDIPNNAICLVICCLRALFKFIHGFRLYSVGAVSHRRYHQPAAECIHCNWNGIVMLSTRASSICVFLLYSFRFQRLTLTIVSIPIWLYKVLICVVCELKNQLRLAYGTYFWANF